MRADLALSLGVLLAIFAALLPLLTVLKPGPWLPAAVLLTAIVLAAGYFGRRIGLRALVVSLIEILLWALFLTFVFFRETALLWLIPTPATAREVPDALAAAFQDINLGSAPMTVSAELAFLIVGATALLAIIVDHVVLTARMPLLAGVGLVAVSLIPSIVVPQGVDIMAFALLAGAVLYLIRTETRSRDLPAAREASRAAGVPATALGIGAIAIVVAIVVTPLLPPPTPIVAGQPGLGQGIDVTLQLGDDLRQPRITEALRLHTDAPAPPYLRAATLSVFTGAVWQPDRMRAVPLDSDNALSEVAVTSGVKVSEYTTEVEVRELVASWLPVAFPAVAVTGLDGTWKVVPYNRTVLSQSGSTRGQTYQVVTHVPRPTLEQIRVAEAGGPQIRDDTTALPPDLPPIIAETAAAVTAGTSTDYDALIALQRWFRGSDFRYSLKAPVEEGFDGSGADAVAKFLEVKQGYCVHFASAFALMARTLGMPTRIVVGYLPGNPTTEKTPEQTGEQTGGQTIYSVFSSQLHAWPEVYFNGVGWVPFEPTASLGVPTSFSPASTTLGDLGAGTDVTSTPSPTASGATANPLDDGLDGAPSESGSAVPRVDPLPTVSIIFGILLALSIPALLRAFRGRRLLQAARDGDAAAAWVLVQDSAIDLGIAAPGSESPRALAARLVGEHGAPAEPMRELVVAIERASYAPGAARRRWTDASIPAAAVCRGLFREAPRARQLLAVFAPRSLIVRPGSVYAAAGAGPAAERATARER